MELLEPWIQYIANQTSTLAPLNLIPPNLQYPLPPSLNPFQYVPHIAGFVDHVTTTHVHETYYPFLRFGAIHATRVCLMWSKLTKADREKGSTGKGRLQDLFGYLVAAWGSATIVSFLLSQPPSWLLSPTPWIIYVSVYFLLIPTGIAPYAINVAPTFIDLVGSFCDGLTRGNTLSALPDLLNRTLPTPPNIWTSAIFGGLATCSGAWVVQGLNLYNTQWSLGVPSIIAGKGYFLLDSMDFWGGAITTLLFTALQRKHADLAIVSDMLMKMLPDDLVTAPKISVAGLGAERIVQPDIARALVVMFFGSILFSREILKRILPTAGGSQSGKTAKKSIVDKKDQDDLLYWLEDEKTTNQVGASTAVKSSSQGKSEKHIKHRKKRT